jgi:hypothetical protein
MTPTTPQYEVFCPLLSSSEHSGVPEDSKSPTFPSVGLHPHTWPKWGCDITQDCGMIQMKEKTNHPLHFYKHEPIITLDKSIVIMIKDQKIVGWIVTTQELLKLNLRNQVEP